MNSSLVYRGSAASDDGVNDVMVDLCVGPIYGEHLLLLQDTPIPGMARVTLFVLERVQSTHGTVLSMLPFSKGVCFAVHNVVYYRYTNQWYCWVFDHSEKVFRSILCHKLI